MQFRGISRLYRRAVLIYIVTIAAPVCGLLWLGVQSFERQRQSLVALTAEKLAGALESSTLAAARDAFEETSHPIVRDRFLIEHGTVTRPMLHAPPPLPVPTDFQDAERQELDLNRPDQALQSYRKLATSGRYEALALSRIARCLGKLGRADEARATWRKLAQAHPDGRDGSGRPYGIVASIEAGDTRGLYEKIISGRWDLAAGQAEYFLAQLDPSRTTPYLDQFHFARELEEQFRPPGAPRKGEVYSYTLGRRRLFYKSEGADRFAGFVVNDGWVNHTLRPRLEHQLGIADTSKNDLRVYGAAIALVLLILSFGVILLLRDISREARTNRVRADLVSSVSHELKTPITLIRLHGETLMRRSEITESERGDFYRVIVRESERLTRLVNQILTFSRVERDALAYNFEHGDLAPVVAGIVEEHREYLEGAGFHVQRTLPESAPTVRFDPAALSQAVVNLLDNAVKYSGESRDIAIRLESCEGNVTFEVEDHGIGIPPREQSKIFDRFYRVPNGIGKGGYGLGLFLVRHIMEAHGGRAEVESELGRGSRFRLIFPVAAS